MARKTFFCAVVFYIAALGIAFAQSSKKIEVKTGERVSIELEANPTTGYSWQLENPTPKLVQDGEPVFQPDNANLMGSGGKEVWTFKAVSAGEVLLRFAYARAWEKDSPVKKQEIFVKIEKSVNDGF